MGVDEILREVIRIHFESKTTRKSAKVALRLSKSEINYAYTIGSPLVTDELVRQFDLFSSFTFALINILFDGTGGNKVSVMLFKHGESQ